MGLNYSPPSPSYAANPKSTLTLAEQRAAAKAFLEGSYDFVRGRIYGAALHMFGGSSNSGRDYGDEVDIPPPPPRRR